MSASETTRRAVLAGTAAIGSMELLPFVRSAQAASTAASVHPDAALIDLAELFAAARARRDKIDRQLDDAYDHFERPEMPEAIYWRPSDFIWVWINRGLLAQYGSGADARWVYEDDSEVIALRENLAVMKAADIANGGWGTSEHAITRTEEILAAHAVWMSACKDAEDRAGITALNEASNRESELAERLELRIVAIRARTPEGLAAKARAASISWSHSGHYLEHEILPKILAQDGDRKNIWSVSLIVDGMHLDDATRLDAEGPTA